MSSEQTGDQPLSDPDIVVRVRSTRKQMDQGLLAPPEGAKLVVDDLLELQKRGVTQRPTALPWLQRIAQNPDIYVDLVRHRILPQSRETDPDTATLLAQIQLAEAMGLTDETRYPKVSAKLKEIAEKLSQPPLPPVVATLASAEAPVPAAGSPSPEPPPVPEPEAREVTISFEDILLMSPSVLKERPPFNQEQRENLVRLQQKINPRLVDEYLRAQPEMVLRMSVGSQTSDAVKKVWENARRKLTPEQVRATFTKNPASLLLCQQPLDGEMLDQTQQTIKQMIGQITEGQVRVAIEQDPLFILKVQDFYYSMRGSDPGLSSFFYKQTDEMTIDQIINQVRSNPISILGFNLDLSTFSGVSTRPMTLRKRLLAEVTNLTFKLGVLPIWTERSITRTPIVDALADWAQALTARITELESGTTDRAWVKIRENWSKLIKELNLPAEESWEKAESEAAIQNQLQQRALSSELPELQNIFERFGTNSEEYYSRLSWLYAEDYKRMNHQDFFPSDREQARIKYVDARDSLEREVRRRAGVSEEQDQKILLLKDEYDHWSFYLKILRGRLEKGEFPLADPNLADDLVLALRETARAEGSYFHDKNRADIQRERYISHLLDRAGLKVKVDKEDGRVVNSRIVPKNILDKAKDTIKDKFRRPKGE